MTVPPSPALALSPPLDLLIVGGGLSGGLLAHALARRRPELRVALVEPADHYGGNHIWSFFDTDVAAEDRWIVEPFVTHRWEGTTVRFPAYERRLDGPYNSVRSSQFDRVLRDTLPVTAQLRGEAVAVAPTRVVLADQSVLTARGVLDARGGGDLSSLRCGWQKFVGQELELCEPHGLTVPTIMDADVAQLGGYRFVYVLPLSPTRLFVEDTYYTDGPALDVPALRTRVADYAEARGWHVAGVVHEETGVLPVPTGGDFARYWDAGGEAGKLGARAALWNDTTGFSLPDAVRAVAAIVALPEVTGTALAEATRALAASRWRRGGFFRLLDRMLFEACAPTERYRVLQRFYRLHPALIARFYAGETTAFDKVRILAGRPPFPVGRALKVLKERQVPKELK